MFNRFKESCDSPHDKWNRLFYTALLFSSLKARRSLAKIKISVSNQSELEQLIAKTKARIEKAKIAIAKKSDPTPVEVPTTNEPEAKRRREDMDADERKEFDMWLDDVRNKRYGVHFGWHGSLKAKHSVPIENRSRFTK